MTYVFPGDLVAASYDNAAILMNQYVVGLDCGPTRQTGLTKKGHMFIVIATTARRYSAHVLVCGHDVLGWIDRYYLEPA